MGPGGREGVPAMGAPGFELGHGPRGAAPLEHGGGKCRGLAGADHLIEKPWSPSLDAPTKASAAGPRPN